MPDSTLEITKSGGFFSKSEADTLFVLLHAYTSNPKRMQPVADVIRQENPASDIFVPRLPLGTFSLADPGRIVEDLIAAIDVHCDRHTYRRIVLVGHSLGAILARRVWAIAHGATETAAIDVTSARGWAPRIDRMVLLAATSRGWSVSSALSPFSRFAWSLGTAWGNFCRYALRKDPVIFGFRRGAPFLTQTRLQCLEVQKKTGMPITIQLLGTADDLIAPADNVDLMTGNSFYYLEATEGTHAGIVTLSEGKGDVAAKFRLALTGSTEALEKAALKREDVFDLHNTEVDDHDAQVPPVEDEEVQDVVFVIHGIRDRGFWTKRIARAIKTRAREKIKSCRTVTSTYGYFAMGPFLLPWVRRDKVEWLLDQYVTARSLYPHARISYLGHSNGTYLLAKALTICPAVSVHNVVFAGSVVSTKYDWTPFLNAPPVPSDGPLVPLLSNGKPRVSQVVNYIATGDIVVAMFPNGLEMMGLGDLGGAGHGGFLENSDVRNIRFVDGGHGAALRHRRWAEMAAFVLDDVQPETPQSSPDRPFWSTLLGWLSPLLWLAIVVWILGATAAILFGLALGGFAPMGFTLWNSTPTGLTTLGWVLLAALVAHLVSVWLVLTKV